ncbi:MAG: zf-HC2 domain-containing protein [Planctomycetes bacterium]|nr:zf-HC2 domain-containing protein [Planctomycetota bacterium]
MAGTEHSEHAAECRNLWQKWAGFLDKELSAEESARVQKHLDACGHCREFFETQSSFNRLLRKSLIAESQELPENLRVKVLSLLERKSMGQLSAEDERANMAAPAHGHGALHSHAHDHPSSASGQAGEPGHVHDHDHGHTHSHGMSPATRALFAVMLVGLVLVGLLALTQRNRNQLLSEQLAGLEKQVGDAKAREEDMAALQKLLRDAKGERVLAERERDEEREKNKALQKKYDESVIAAEKLLRDAKGERVLAERERDEEREKNKALQKKYDESVIAAEKLQKALTALVNAGSAVMKLPKDMKPVPELEKKWREMFPQIGEMPHRSGDMDPTLWDVSPIEGEDVLWVVFSKKGDPKTQFTLMTFSEKYVREHFGELKGMAETVKDGMTVCAWPNAKDSRVYHALISTADLKTTREQLQALK